MLLAKIKGNKVDFGKLVTFSGGGGVCLRPTYPLDPLEGVLGGHLLKDFPRGIEGVSQNFKSKFLILISFFLDSLPFLLYCLV